jgi:hypothetical protein
MGIIQESNGVVDGARNFPSLFLLLYSLPAPSGIQQQDPNQRSSLIPVNRMDRRPKKI